MRPKAWDWATCHNDTMTQSTQNCAWLTPYESVTRVPECVAHLSQQLVPPTDLSFHDAQRTASESSACGNIDLPVQASNFYLRPIFGLADTMCCRHARVCCRPTANRRGSSNQSATTSERVGSSLHGPQSVRLPALLRISTTIATITIMVRLTLPAPLLLAISHHMSLLATVVAWSNVALSATTTCTGYTG